MKSSTAFSILFLLPAIQAASLQRSQQDGMLRRNFKNVLQEDASSPHVARSPQGPSSNPGEFTNVGLSNSNPANQGGESNSGSDSGSGFVPEPVMDSPSSISSSPTVDDTSSSVSGMPTGYVRSGYPPMATGHHHHRHHNKTRELLEVETEVEPDGEIVVEETLWQFNGTGWNSTNIPLPSGSVIGTLVPGPTGTGYARPTGSGYADAGRFRGPGFTGPGERMTANEIAADGTGADQMGPSGVESAGASGMEKREEPKDKRWLSGLI